MSYQVTGYMDGRVRASGKASDIHKALEWASDCLSGAGGCFHCNEVEVTTNYKGRDVLVAYVYDDDLALERAEQ